MVGAGTGLSVYAWRAEQYATAFAHQIDPPVAAAAVTVNGDSISYTNQISVEAGTALAWRWRTNLNVNDALLHTTSASRTVRLLESGGNFRFQIQGGSDGADSGNISLGSIPAGAWYHEAGTWDRATSTLSAYANGVRASTVVTSDSWSNEVPNSTFFIAESSSNPGPTQGCASFISNLRIYNRALTPTEIQAIYLSQLGGMIADARPSLPGEQMLAAMTPDWLLPTLVHALGGEMPDEAVRHAKRWVADDPATFAPTWEMPQ
jgi:hypothetical protein